MMDGFDDITDNYDNFENEDELLNAAISNTYEYLISDLDIQELPAGTWMLKQPRRIKTIDQLISYFTETEEYEKCAELVKIKQTIN
tara:strand:- start:1083 stop:1340 length:258 start_codon:yes stop_codon:yes gene_type:complete